MQVALECLLVARVLAVAVFASVLDAFRIPVMIQHAAVKLKKIPSVRPQPRRLVNLIAPEIDMRIERHFIKRFHRSEREISDAGAGRGHMAFHLRRRNVQAV